MLLDRFHPAKGWPSGFHWAVDTFPGAFGGMICGSFLGHLMAVLKGPSWSMGVFIAYMLASAILILLTVLRLPKLSDLAPGMRQVLCGTFCAVSINDDGDVHVRINRVIAQTTAAEVEAGDFSGIAHMPGIDLKKPGKHRRQLAEAVRDWKWEKKARTRATRP